MNITEKTNIDEQNNILDLIYSLSHIKDIDGEDNPNYCFAQEICDIFGVEEDEVIQIAKDNGYKTFKLQPVDGLYDGGTIIADKDCTLDIIKADYIDFYEVDPDIKPLNEDLNEDVSLAGTSIEDFDKLALDKSLKDNYDILEGKDNIKNQVHLKDIVKKITNIEENIEKHDELNPKLWNEDHTLKEEVKAKINQIVDEFINALKEDEIKIKIKDIRLVGSNCSYNYNDQSDLDIHIIADTDGLECPEKHLSKLYSAYRSIFNKNFDIDFYGVPVEVYVETEDSTVDSNGVFSVKKDKWLKEPVQEDIPEINQEEINAEKAPWEEKADKIITDPSVEAIEAFIEDIYKLRKESIAKDGEYAIGNLIFKELRSEGKLDQLKDLRKECLAKEMSLEDKQDEQEPITEPQEEEEKIMNESLSTNLKIYEVEKDGLPEVGRKFIAFSTRHENYEIFTRQDKDYIKKQNWDDEEGHVSKDGEFYSGAHDWIYSIEYSRYVYLDELNLIDDSFKDKVAKEKVAGQEKLDNLKKQLKGIYGEELGKKLEQLIVVSKDGRDARFYSYYEKLTQPIKYASSLNGLYKALKEKFDKETAKQIINIKLAKEGATNKSCYRIKVTKDFDIDDFWFSVLMGGNAKGIVKDGYLYITPYLKGCSMNPDHNIESFLNSRGLLAGKYFEDCSSDYSKVFKDSLVESLIKEAIEDVPYNTKEKLDVLRSTVKSDGTYSYRNNHLVKEHLSVGYQVSFFRPEITDEDIQLCLKELDSKLGQVYLGIYGGDTEISYCLGDQDKAMEIAKCFNQYSIWDHKEGKEIKNESFKETQTVNYKTAIKNCLSILNKKGEI